MNDIGKMFNPKTIALVGASDKAGSIGRAILTNLLQTSDRRVFPVNPNKKTVLDIPSLPGPREHFRENRPCRHRHAGTDGSLDRGGMRAGRRGRGHHRIVRFQGDRGRRAYSASRRSWN